MPFHYKIIDVIDFQEIFQDIAVTTKSTRIIF